jgi:hypothetical protein
MTFNHRADLHGVYVIIPPKEGEIDEDHMECMVTFIAQLDPRGWIWRNFGYQQTFLQHYMMHMIDIRDALDSERFVQVKTHLSPPFVCSQVNVLLSLLTFY